MKGLFIPGITKEMFRNASVESVAELMADGEIYDIDYQEPCKDAINKQVVKEQMIKYGFHAPDMTVTEFAEDLLPVALKSATVTDSADKFKEIDFKTIKNGKFVNDKE